MGAVYKVEHVRMGKVMALKVMRPEFARDKEAVARFVSEAQIVSRLAHVHTISVFDFGEAEDGSLYIAMEYCPGQDLASALASEGRFSEERAASVVCQVLRSLAEAHDAGIVHRDMKPGNVMLLKSREGDDFAKVLDFGIAKLSERKGGQKLTGRGEFIGTPNYMAPEQARAAEPTPASDIYSVGAMLFELITGRLPFEADTPLSMITAHVTQPAPSPRKIAKDAVISQEMDEIVLRALRKEPEKRFASADEMRKALERIAHRSPPREVTLDRVETTGEYEIASRDDWLRFEEEFTRQMRGRRFAPALVVVLLLSLSGLVVTYQDQLEIVIGAPSPVAGFEREPNNTSGDANELSVGEVVRGSILGRHDGKGDEDTFAVHIKEPRKFVATVRLSPLPDINLQLVLFDGTGRQLAKIDREPAGVEEVATRVGLTERLFVSVRQNTDGGAPKENSRDTYSLRVELFPREDRFEVEPNDTVEEATPLVWESGSTVTYKGILGAKGSRDAYAIEGVAGASMMGLFVTGVPETNVAIQLVDDPSKPPRRLVDETPTSVGEIAKLQKAGKWFVFVDVFGGKNHDQPYEIFAFLEGKSLLHRLEALRRDGNLSEAVFFASRAAHLWPKDEVAPELLWLSASAAREAAEKLTLSAAKEEKLSFAGGEPPEKPEVFKKLGVSFRYLPVQRRYVYVGEAYKRLLAEHAKHPRAEEARVELIPIESCGPSAVARRAEDFLRRFKQSELRSKALLYLGLANEDLARLGDRRARKKAEAAFRRLLLEFPASEEAASAKRRNESAPVQRFSCE